LIQTDQLKELNQIMVKQLKNRYNDPELFKRFVIGVDKPKMRLYDTEQSAQDDISDSGAPVYDNTPSGAALAGAETRIDRSKFTNSK